jgi:hypothetical protein
MRSSTGLACIMATFFTIFCVILTARTILRDILWFVIILNITTLTNALTIYNKFGIKFSSFLLCMISANLLAAIHAYVRHDARDHKYGWNPYMWQQCVFFGNHQRYKNFIFERYSLSGLSAKVSIGPGLSQAIRYMNVLRTAQFVFPGNVITLRQIGSTSPGYPVHTDRTSWRINQLDAPLKDGIVVDMLNFQQRPSGLLPSPPCSEVTSDWPLAFYDDTRDTVSVLPRTDISVWLIDYSETLK